MFDRFKHLFGGKKSQQNTHPDETNNDMWLSPEEATETTKASSSNQAPTGGSTNTTDEPQGIDLASNQFLEKQMRSLASTLLTNTKSERIEILKRLQHSHVLLPLPKGTSVSKDKGIPMWVLENDKGNEGVPVFTSELMLSKWVNETTNYIEISFKDLCTSAVQAELDFILLNLNDQSGMEVFFHEFTYMAEGILPPDNAKSVGELRLEKDTTLQLNTQYGLPMMLDERLSALLRGNKDVVECAYAFEVSFGEGPLRPALGIHLYDSCESDWEQTVWPNILVTLQETMGDKEYINIFVLNHAPDLANKLKSVDTPFFSAQLESEKDKASNEFL